MGDIDKVAIAEAELALLLNKKEQAQVFKARLNRIPGEVMNMATELHVEELQNASDQHIMNVTATIYL